MSLIRAIVNKFPTLTFQASCENQVEVGDEFHSARFTMLSENICECECRTATQNVKFTDTLEKCVDEARKIMLPDLGFLDTMVWLSDRDVDYAIDVDEEINATVIIFGDFTITHLDDPIFTHRGNKIRKGKFQGMIVSAYGL